MPVKRGYAISGIKLILMLGLLHNVLQRRLKQLNSCKLHGSLLWMFCGQKLMHLFKIRHHKQA